MSFHTLRWVPLLALVAGCEPSTAAPDLEDRVFVSQQVLLDDEAQVLAPGTQLMLRFFESPRIGASAGCNSLDGEYEIVDDRFRVSGGAQTERGCDTGLHEQDDWYFAFIQSEPAITVDGDALILEGGGRRIEYLDQEVATPDADLTGTMWQVDTLIDGEVASAAAWPEPATISFGEGGTADVFTGCNTGTVVYEVAGAELTFADLTVTEEGCPDEQAQMLEQAVVDLLRTAGPVSWEITVDRLELSNGTLGLGLQQAS